MILKAFKHLVCNHMDYNKERFKECVEKAVVGQLDIIPDKGNIAFDSRTNEPDFQIRQGSISSVILYNQYTNVYEGKHKSITITLLCTNKKFNSWMYSDQYVFLSNFTPLDDVLNRLGDEWKKTNKEHPGETNILYIPGLEMFEAPNLAINFLVVCVPNSPEDVDGIEYMSKQDFVNYIAAKTIKAAVKFGPMDELYIHPYDIKSLRKLPHNTGKWFKTYVNERSALDNIGRTLFCIDDLEFMIAFNNAS